MAGAWFRPCDNRRRRFRFLWARRKMLAHGDCRQLLSAAPPARHRSTGWAPASDWNIFLCQCFHILTGNLLHRKSVESVSYRFDVEKHRLCLPKNGPKGKKWQIDPANDRGGGVGTLSTGYPSACRRRQCAVNDRRNAKIINKLSKVKRAKDLPDGD